MIPQIQQHPFSTFPLLKFFPHYYFLPDVGSSIRSTPPEIVAVPVFIRDGTSFGNNASSPVIITFSSLRNISLVSEKGVFLLRDELGGFCGSLFFVLLL